MSKIKLTSGAGNSRPKGVVILGSTGSIGRSTISVVKNLRGFRVVGLAARSDVKELERQIGLLKPRFVSVSDRGAAGSLRERVGKSVTVFDGPDGAAELVGVPGVDIVVSAMVGSAGLKPTLAAAKRGLRIALANKETLVVGGEIITREIRKSKGSLLPVDSEHSAIFQCLQGAGPDKVRRIMLTGSGGPFRARRSMAGVTVREALRHPTWKMGKKITIDSATMMNKGLEIIEAKWLFGIPVRRIEVVVHPQSIVHSLVELADGSILAQMGLPDMRLPIQYALTFPDRVEGRLPRLNLCEAGPLTFEKPDLKRFPCIGLAREAAERGGSLPIVLNAANEAAVQAFLDGRMGFGGIPKVIERTMRRHRVVHPRSIDEIVAIDRSARRQAEEAVEKVR